jgi:hypothetical protein
VLALVVVLAAIDVIAGSTLADPPLIPRDERLEMAPSVRPGDIEYQVQRDGEKLYLSPNDGPRWHQSTVHSETTNWDDTTGRRTHQPTSPGPSTHRIAVIGGSAAFGLGQSDDMTIASEIARLRTGLGENVEVLNFGVPAYTTLQAVRDLEDRIEHGLQVDEVIAYSGFNDVALGFYGRRVPQTLLDGATDAPRGPFVWWADHSAIARLLGRQPVRKKPIVWRVLNTDFDGSWELSSRTGAEATRDALYNLEEGYEALIALSARHALDVSFTYQPTWFEASLADVDTKLVNMDELGRDLMGARWGMVRKQFTEQHSDVIDAAHSVDNAPCWLDFTHTRGACSILIARHIVAGTTVRDSGPEFER